MLASTFPQYGFRFIVQDREEVISGATLHVYDKKSAEKVAFMAHDFFQQQPVKDADVYLLRLTMHNWPEKTCVTLLKNLVPALRKGAKILVNEIVLPSTRSEGSTMNNSDVWYIIFPFLLVYFHSSPAWG